LSLSSGCRRLNTLSVQSLPFQAIHWVSGFRMLVRRVCRGHGLSLLVRAHEHSRMAGCMTMVVRSRQFRNDNLEVP
jgi:hypothetical protein